MTDYCSTLESATDILLLLNQNLLTARNRITTITRLFRENRKSGNTKFSDL